MKNFCSAQEIEDMAAQGRTELVIDENTVLTDLARHAAQQLGVKIVYKSQSGTPPTATPGPAPAVPGLARPGSLRLGSKPKGCQHGPLTPSPAAGATIPPGNADPAPNSGRVVDQLVGLVKRLGNKGGN